MLKPGFDSPIFSSLGIKLLEILIIEFARLIAAAAIVKEADNVELRFEQEFR